MALLTDSKEATLDVVDPITDPSVFSDTTDPSLYSDPLLGTTTTTEEPVVTINNEINEIVDPALYSDPDLGGTTTTKDSTTVVLSDTTNEPPLSGVVNAGTTDGSSDAYTDHMNASSQANAQVDANGNPVYVTYSYDPTTGTYTADYSAFGLTGDYATETFTAEEFLANNDRTFSSMEGYTSTAEPISGVGFITTPDYGTGTVYDTPNEALANYADLFAETEAQRDETANTYNYNNYDPADFARAGYSGVNDPALLGQADKLVSYVRDNNIPLYQEVDGQRYYLTTGSGDATNELFGMGEGGDTGDYIAYGDVGTYSTVFTETASVLNNPVLNIAAMFIPFGTAALTAVKAASGETLHAGDWATLALGGLEVGGVITPPVEGAVDAAGVADAGTGLLGTTYQQTQNIINAAGDGDFSGAITTIFGGDILDAAGFGADTLGSMAEAIGTTVEDLNEGLAGILSSVATGSSLSDAITQSGFTMLASGAWNDQLLVAVGGMMDTAGEWATALQDNVLDPLMEVAGDVADVLPLEEMIDGFQTLSSTLGGAVGGVTDALADGLGILTSETAGLLGGLVGSDEISIASLVGTAGEGLAELASATGQTIEALLSAAGIELTDLTEATDAQLQQMSADIYDLYSDVSGIVSGASNNTDHLANIAALDLENLATATGSSIEDLINGAGTNLNDLAESTGQSIEDLLSATGVSLEDLATATGQSIDDLVSGAGINLDALTTATGLSLDEVLGSTGTALDDMLNNTATSLEGMLSSTSTAIRELRDQASSDLVDLSTATGASIDDLISGAGTSLENLASATGQTIEEMLSASGTSLEALSSATGQSIEDLVSGAGANLQDLADATGSTIDELMGQTGTALTDLINETDVAIGSLVTSAADDLNSLANTAATILEALSSSTGTSLENLIAGTGTTLTDMATATGQTVEELLGGAESGLADLAEATGQSIQELLAASGTSLEELATATGESIADLTSGAAGNLDDLASATGQSIEDLVGQAGANLDDLATATGQTLDELLGGTGNALEDMLSSAEGQLGDLVTATGETIGAITAGVQEGLSDLTGATGEALEDMTNAAQEFYDSVEGQIDDAINEGGSAFNDNVLNPLKGILESIMISVGASHISQDEGREAMQVAINALPKATSTSDDLFEFINTIEDTQKMVDFDDDPFKPNYNGLF